jgi:serine/threonine protein kinase
MEEPLQKSLERYDVLDRIAVGGMAEVFLAKAYGAHGFEKTLAIKRILPELARDPEFAARFIAEAKVAVKLSHANVVQVFDFGRIGESLFIAMEYVDGLDLAAMLGKYRSEKRLVPLPAAFHIAIEIVRALDFAHTHNVVHRDVSPSNILISRAGEVKIADFGIAVAASRPTTASQRSGPRKVMGKWRYMSPEQTRGDTLDTRSDLFSAASVMFELFTGEKLFPGEEADEIIKNIHEMPIPRASTLRPGLPSRLDEILAGPLARKPIDRPNRPAVVLRALIELSYESSIMATAMDVADAIATLIPPARKSGPGAQLDDVIRKQLGDRQEKSIARRTAVTANKPTETATATLAEPEATSTGLFRKLDVDGVSRLEEVDPTAVGSPRARRASEQQTLPEDLGEKLAADSQDLAAFYDAQKDPDRHTEVGGPPTGQVAKAGDSLFLDKKGARRVVPQKRSRGPVVFLLVLIAVLSAAAGGIAIYSAMRPPDPQNEIKPPVTNPADNTGIFEIDSVPSKATAIVNGKRDALPRSFRVTAGVKIHVEIELAGYKLHEDDYQVDAGKTLVIKPRLEPLPASLHVTTDPPNCQVALNQRPLGDSGTTFTDLAAGKDQTLTLTKTGYDPQTLKIDLKQGETTEVTQQLKQTTRYGDVRFGCNGPVVDVYLNNAKIAVTGRDETIKLPVGKQRVTFKKGETSWQMDIEVTGQPRQVIRTRHAGICD